MYCVNGKYFADLYRNKLSGYAQWCESELGCGFYFNAANIGPYMSLDETCLSNGEVWTFLTWYMVTYFKDVQNTQEVMWCYVFCFHEIIQSQWYSPPLLH